MAEEDMEKVEQKIALYPGCSLEGTSENFRISLEKVFDLLGVECTELDEWNCCGATSAHAMDEKLFITLNTRNLALAEQQGYDEVLAPCAACYHRLASTNFELQEDAELLKTINTDAELNYQGGVKVRNVLDFLANVVGSGKIASKVTNPLTGMRVACYYGCLNTRIPRMAAFDDREYPMTMDRVVNSLGAQTIDWAYKTECCGGSLFISAESVSAKLAAKILKDAAARDADCIVVSCPLCQNNLDTKQEEIREEHGISRPIPILFISQLMGLAFGLGERELALQQNFVPLVVGAASA